MAFIEFVVRNPVKTAVGVLLVALFGLVGLRRMPMQLTPEVEVPTISIETRWPGASPPEVEREIVLEQEEQLKGVEGVTKMTSESMHSEGRITLEFAVGTDMQEALVKVNSRLQQVPEYPEDAKQPVISTSSISGRPIAWFVLSARQVTQAEIEAFVGQNPHLAEALAPVLRAQNPGLQLKRLRDAARQHPELAVLLPPDVDIATFRRFAENVIEPRLERVKGVSNANVMGGLDEELQVIVDADKLAARNLTIADVRNVLRAENRDTSAGDYWEGKRRNVVRVLGQFRSVRQVADTVLAMRDGVPVFVRDVAEVRLGYKKPDGFVRRYGTASIAINAQRETGANVLEVMAGLKQAVAELNAGPLRAQHLQLTQVYDETDYIYSAIDLVQQNIYIGGALTMIVLMFFLHREPRTLVLTPLIAFSAVAAAYVSGWFFVLSLLLIVASGFWFARGALVVGLAIPTSIVGTFLVLSLLGRSLNVISLAGLAFAVGMLVDNAVVVLENIYRRYQRGERPLVAAVRATTEVWGAVAASTLTTLAVFLPVVFVQEEAGQLFRDIALAISSAVGLSLVVSVTVIPTAAARLLRQDEAGHKGWNAAPHGVRYPLENGDAVEPDVDGRDAPAPQRSSPRRPLARLWDARGSTRRMVAGMDRFGQRFGNLLVAVNRWLLATTWRGAGFVVGLLGICLLLVWLLWPKVEYLPTGNRNLVIGRLLPPPGYHLDAMLELATQVEQRLQKYWDTDPGTPEAEQLDGPVIGDLFFVVRRQQDVFVGARAHDPARVAELVPVVRNALQGLPGVIAVAQQSSLFERSLAAGRNIDIEITGPDLPTLIEIGRRVYALVTTHEQLRGSQVRPMPSLDLSNPELQFRPDGIRIRELGMNNTELGYAVDALIDGAYAGDFYIGGDKIDLTIVGRESVAGGTYYSHSQDLAALPTVTPGSPLPVRLESLAVPRLGSGPEQINRRERERAITIQVSPPEGVPLEVAMAVIQQEIVPQIRSEGWLDGGGYVIGLSGTADKLRQTWDALYFNFVFAAVITYLLMAALFESWLYPLVIIASVLLGMVGGIAGLELLNAYLGVTGQGFQTLDVLTMLGFVILIGTVVNNPILIVHQSLNHMREDGMSPDEAILLSVRTRIRPIFMTTATTVLGLLPLVLFPGAGNELYRGLGSVVLGGLVVSTLFTLVLVPTLFHLTMQAKETVLRLLGWDRPTSDDVAEETLPPALREPHRVLPR
jgi:HAE1 family hydrophobic/amphiphilic exporter-1